jgi:pimeloyl-ACP methyl ester carboxylesterase
VITGTAPNTTVSWAQRPDYNGGWTLGHSRHRALASADGWEPTLVDRLAVGGTPDHVSWLYELYEPEMFSEPDLLDALPSIGLPVLIIHGEQDDTVLLESARYLAGALPNAELEIFQRSGNVPFAEEPEAFGARVLVFLESL